MHGDDLLCETEQQADLTIYSVNYLALHTFLVWALNFPQRLPRPRTQGWEAAELLLEGRLLSTRQGGRGMGEELLGCANCRAGLENSQEWV